MNIVKVDGGHSSFEVPSIKESCDKWVKKIKAIPLMILRN
jgi:hypothetical protein